MESQPATRRILVAISGMSPQIVTETLFALATNSDEPPVSAIYLLTTEHGRQIAEATLTGPNGHISALCRDYSLPIPDFPLENILVFGADTGLPLFDIRTVKDNEITADLITETLRKLTADPDCALHVSLSGGRKTMVFYMGYALSLFGRQQDQLSHVLVDPAFENNTEFWYPTPYPKNIPGHNGIQLNAAEAKVSLATIPFIRLRDDLPAAILDRQVGFSEAVRLSNLLHEPSSLIIDYPRQQAICSGIAVAMPRRELAFLGMFARAQRDVPEIEVPKKGERQLALARSYFEELVYSFNETPSATFKGIVDQLSDLGLDSRIIAAMTTKDGKPGMERQYFDSRKSEVKNTLIEALGTRLADRFQIVQSDSAEGGTNYRLTPVDSIKFVEDHT